MKKTKQEPNGLTQALSETRGSARARSRCRKILSSALMIGLLVPLISLGGGKVAAQAADGEGDGSAVIVGVAADNFNTSKVSRVNIVPSKKYPGTVRIERDGGKKCLATDYSKGMFTFRGAQWTGCNSHSSKNWVVEPYHTTTQEELREESTDDTVRALNVLADGESPRFILRSYRYPNYCFFSTKNGFGGSNKDIGITSTCSAAETAVDAKGDVVSAKEMHFAITNDTYGNEWEFLRTQMRAGAAAIYGRGLDRAFTGENLWVKPMSTDLQYVGLASKASADGYFLPGAVEIDPDKEGAVVARTSSTDSCLDNKWWWGIDNTRGRTPVQQSVSTGIQHTDQMGWALGLELGHETEGQIAFLKGKFSVKVKGDVHKSWSTSVTTQQSLSMTVPEGQWGMAVVTTPTVTTLGNWKTGTALNRPWKFNGLSTVALKNNRGEPADTVAAFVQSHERKSCRARPETDLIAGQSPTVIVPGGRLVPQVGDTLEASAPFRDPQDGTALDVRYQWYQDATPLAGQTLQTLEVTNAMVGKQIGFKTFESGGDMRFESTEYLSTQTAAVQPESSDPAAVPALPEGIEGQALEMRLHGIAGLGDDISVQEDQLPPGLSYDAENDTISGVPSEPGIYTLQLTDENEQALEVTFTVDAAPTVFPSEVGIASTVGDTVQIPLVNKGGTDSTFNVEFFTPEGDPIEAPEWAELDHEDSNALSLIGTPDAVTELVVRVTESNPHHEAGDGRETQHEIRLKVSERDPDSGAPVPTMAPEVSIARVASDDGTEPADGPITVGELASWQVRAEGAEELDAVVHEAGKNEPLAWADVARTLEDELEIDATPETAGNYVITVTASNSAGTTVQDYEFAAVASDDGGADGSDDASGGSDGSSKPARDDIARTGSDIGVAGGVALALGLAVAGLGAWLLARRRDA